MKSNNLIRLENTIKDIAKDGKMALAYSGGVDSSILLAVARGAGIDVLPLTFDISKARDIPQIRNNSKERCYYCKDLMMRTFSAEAAAKGYEVLCDGTNVDDRKQYRPGLRALQEQGVRSPIAEAGLTKEQLRAVGRELGLPVADKPSSPCLLTRFPYDTYVSEDMLATVGKAEDIVKAAGHPACRVRVYGETAKIEVPKEEILSAETNDSLIANVLSALLPIGVSEVIVDEKGLRSGTMDE